MRALRLSAQRIGVGGAGTVAEIARWMLALQGQDLPGVKWSVGLRAAGVTELDVDAAFGAGEIVRSWPLRGTLHLVAGEDLGWLLQLTMPRAGTSAAGRRAALGITSADVERARETAETELAGRRVLTRNALLAAFERAGVGTGGQRGYHLLWYLALTGTLVLGPMAGRQQTFARLDGWVPSPRHLERDEALGELARRYFQSHGPATVPDLARWSGLTVADVRRGTAVAGRDLAAIEIDGVTYHLAPETSALAGPMAAVHLLPGFDEYLLGYRDRTVVLAQEHSRAIVPGDNGMFRPTIVVDGEVVGTWTRTNETREIVVEPVPFGRLSEAARAGLGAAAKAYGTYLGRPVRVADVGE